MKQSTELVEGVRDLRQTPCMARAAMSIAWPSFMAAAALTECVIPVPADMNCMEPRPSVSEVPVES